MLTRLRRYPIRATWAVTGLLTIASGIMLIPLVDLSSPRGAPFEIRWWELAILFAVVELGGIHISTRRGAHTLTLAELPLVLGLASSAPIALAGARLLGLLGTLSWARWQNSLKLAFNLANSLFGTMLAITIMLAIVAGESIIGPRGWLAVGVGVAVEGLVSGLLVAIVIAVNDPDRLLADTVRGLSVSWIMSGATAVTGILVFIALSQSMWAAILAALVVGGLVFSVKTYGRLHGRHEELTAVFGLTRAIEGSLGIQEIVDRVLRESSRLLRADSVELLHMNSAGEWIRSSLEPDGEITSNTLPEETAHRITAALGHHVLTLEGEVPAPLAAWQTLGGLDHAVASPLVARGTTVGILMVGDRPGPNHKFSDEDIRLISTFSGHVAAKFDQALTEERLRLEVAEKHEVIRSKDQLIAAVSHELRTPLTGILGFAEALKEQGDALDPEMTAEAVTWIANESTDLANIVDDLLTAARFELGALTAHTSPTDLAAIARRVIEATSSRVDASIETDLPSVIADIDGPRVRQILRNLITNAGRYGGDRIIIRTSSENGLAAVEVRDNGPGIGDAEPEMIFAPYKSAHLPGSQPGSVGLGLTVSRHLARLMDGDLTFHRDESWSVFSLTFRTQPGETATESTN